MSLVVWDESYVLGIKEFDQHHQHLVGLLNKIHEHFTSGLPHETLKSVINELIDYATYHFYMEERWMAENSYTELAEHKQEHDLFAAKIVEFQVDLSSGSARFSPQIQSFLNDWLINHILTTDMKYKPYIASL